MVVKIEDLHIGMEIAFSGLDEMDWSGWNVELDKAYKIVELNEQTIHINLTDNYNQNFYIESHELDKVYIVESKKENLCDERSFKERYKPDAMLVLETLDLIARYYDSIPSDLIRELTREHLYEK